MKIPYYPGCSLKTTAKGAETASLAVTKKLGVELVELPKWYCCTSPAYALMGEKASRYAHVVRNFISVQEMNKTGTVEGEYRLLTLCELCDNALKRVNRDIKNNPEMLREVASHIGKRYDGKVEIVNILELLREIGFDKIKRNVKKPLKDLKVSAYYGCLLLRPKEITIDDPWNPQIMEELLESLGATVIDNPCKTRCCGAQQTILDKTAVIRRVYEILSYAIEGGAEAIATGCPLCAFNLDRRGKEATELFPDLNELPIFYFTQLMAIAFGLDEEFCNFDLNYVDPRPLLKSRGLI